jgi:ankyrin repeat protein
VKFLVDAGVDPLNHPHYSLDFDGKPLPTPRLPADVAAEENKPELADFLRGKPIDVEALLALEEERRKSWDSSVDLEAAVRNEHEQKTAHLLRGPARVEAVQRAIELATRAGFKPHLNEAGKDGDTALTLAASNGDVEIVSALLAAGADPNQSGGYFHAPPIYHAVINGHARVLEKLLASGADPNRKDKRGLAPLVKAADRDDLEIVKLLLDAGADPKIKEDSTGITPMMVEPGLHDSAIKALLREAVKKRSGGKPEKGQGLSFVGKKKPVDLATASGVKDFRKFYYDSHPEWSVAFIRGNIQDVAKTYAEMTKPLRWEIDIAKKKISPDGAFVFLLQLKDSPWTILLRSLGFYAEIDQEARVLSQRLGTRVYSYQAEDTSGAEDYELFENGESLEKATQCEGLTFTSKLRPQPQFTDQSFPDPVFAAEKIYLPACFPESDGYNIKLVLKALMPSDVARADFIVILD